MNSNKSSMVSKFRPFLLKNPIQHYAWGMRGENAFIPRLLDMDVDLEKTYAELWIGAHQKASSEVNIDGVNISLFNLIQQYPVEFLGEYVLNKFSRNLPFLFKILSSAEALSIQTHPNKKQAIVLHARDPKNYPDDNHKPELAIALDELTALVGFKSFKEIQAILEYYPEISDFIGRDISNKLISSVNLSQHKQLELNKLIFSTLMRRSVSNKNGLETALSQLEKRLNKSQNKLNEEETLFLDQREKYGADVGLFSIFFLNLIHLKAGEGVFTDSGIPHAYIKGNIVECMANSDNVVRAGLTPKFKDVETLIDILDYELKPIKILGKNQDAEEIVYQIPVSEFRVTRWKFKTGQKKNESSADKPQILLIISGRILITWETSTRKEEETFSKGQAIFIPAALKQFSLLAETPVLMFRVDVP